MIRADIAMLRTRCGCTKIIYKDPYRLERSINVLMMPDIYPLPDENVSPSDSIKVKRRQFDLEEYSKDGVPIYLERWEDG